MGTPIAPTPDPGRQTQTDRCCVCTYMCVSEGSRKRFIPLFVQPNQGEGTGTRRLKYEMNRPGDSRFVDPTGTTELRIREGGDTSPSCLGRPRCVPALPSDPQVSKGSKGSGTSHRVVPPSVFEACVRSRGNRRGSPRPPHRRTPVPVVVDRTKGVRPERP